MFSLLGMTVFVLALFSFNQFALLDLIGIRRIVQILTVPPLLFWGMLVFVHDFKKVLRWPIVIFLLVMTIMLLVKDIDITLFMNVLFVLCVSAVIVVAPYHFIERLVKVIISVVCFFAILGLIQAVVILFKPDVAKFIGLTHQSYSGSQEFILFHPFNSWIPPEGPYFRVLGLGTGAIHWYGPFALTRLRSFLHEPSLVVAYFALPGALSLTFGGRWRKIGVIVLGFATLSISGCFFVILPLSIMAILVLRIRNVYIFLTACVVVAVCFLVFVSNFLPFMLRGYGHDLSWLPYVGGVWDAEKALSVLVRSEQISVAVNAFVQNFFSGVKVNHFQAALGMLVWSAVFGGVVGLLAALATFGDFFVKLHKIFQFKLRRNFLESVPYVFIFAILVEAALFNDYGFSVGFGFTFIVLTYRVLLKVLADCETSADIEGQSAP
jgi:hypothetical protein